MLPTIYKVTALGKGSMSVMAKPVPGEWIEDEFSGLRKLAIDKVVCLLEIEEQKEIGLESEEHLCVKNEMEYESFPISDRGMPTTTEGIEFTRKLYEEILEGKNVVIHCRAGIGRTGIIAGGVLVHHGYTADAAFALITKARGVQVPDTDEQEDWLEIVYRGCQ